MVTTLTFVTGAISTLGHTQKLMGKARNSFLNVNLIKSVLRLQMQTMNEIITPGVRRGQRRTGRVVP
jgi:hypothetical protein